MLFSPDCRRISFQTKSSTMTSRSAELPGCGWAGLSQTRRRSWPGRWSTRTTKRVRTEGVRVGDVDRADPGLVDAPQAALVGLADEQLLGHEDLIEGEAAVVIGGDRRALSGEADPDDGSVRANAALGVGDAGEALDVGDAVRALVLVARDALAAHRIEARRIDVGVVAVNLPTTHWFIQPVPPAWLPRSEPAA